MKDIRRDALKKIAEAVLARMRGMEKEELAGILNMEDYHGFLKSRLPESFLSSILQPLGLTSDDVQIEVVEVNTDLSHEVHYHEHAFAYCVCMGAAEHAQEPRGASAFLTDHWFPVSAGDVVEIPPKTKHGFTVAEGGTLTFLSVQAPPIVGMGSDDYFQTKQ